jgi:hypothetical protein
LKVVGSCFASSFGFGTSAFSAGFSPNPFGRVAFGFSAGFGAGFGSEPFGSVSFFGSAGFVSAGFGAGFGSAGFVSSFVDSCVSLASNSAIFLFLFAF